MGLILFCLKRCTERFITRICMLTANIDMIRIAYHILIVVALLRIALNLNGVLGVGVFAFDGILIACCHRIIALTTGLFFLPCISSVN